MKKALLQKPIREVLYGIGFMKADIRKENYIKEKRKRLISD